MLPFSQKKKKKERLRIELKESFDKKLNIIQNNAQSLTQLLSFEIATCQCRNKKTKQYRTIW